MPTPAKTSPEKLTALAYDILNADGQGGLTMQAVADRAGVRAPSLYKHFADRAALLRAVEAEALKRLAARLTEAAGGQEKNAAALRAMAGAWRAFAQGAPHSYALIFNSTAKDDDANTALRRAAAAPALEMRARRWPAPAR
jgi:AcrR family transcriptional regulator